MNSETITNAITIDVEDWGQSVYDANLAITDRFRRGTDRILAMLDAHDVRATFFVLGIAAEKAPDLIRSIHRAGHEVQSHGYGHRLIDTLTPLEFRADLDRSRKLLEDIISDRISGYRAPAFSVTVNTLWALDAIADAGFACDSSIFPVAMPRYGISSAPWFPHRLRTPCGRELIEVPVASFRMFSQRFPVAGGGYIRLLPYRVIRHGVRQLNRAGHPATIYMHPYEFDPDALAEFPHPISLRRRLNQGLGRRGFAMKIERLLRDFRFGPIREAISTSADLPAFTYDNLVTPAPQIIAPTS